MTKTTGRDGRLEPVGDRWQIRFTRPLAHPPEKVWRALTDPEHRQAWFPDRSIGDFTTVGARLRFELRLDAAGTVLVFSDTITEVGKGARDTAGWHFCFDRLDSALDGTAPDGNPDWRQLNAMYTERFGPDASTMGPPEGHPAAG